jgi:hypothetical protein
MTKSPPKRPPVLDAACSAVQAHYPNCAGAIVAGSVMRGEGTAASDIDILVFFAEGGVAPHRASIVHAGWPVEFFVHTPKSHAYFLAEDRADGTGTIAHMTVHGVALAQEIPLIAARRAAALKVWEAGPPPLASEEVEDRRYFLTDLLDDLGPTRTTLERFGTLSRLYLELADFTLRGAGRWSARGKSLARALRAHDPALACAYEDAFAAGFAGDCGPVVTLAESLLAPHGGRLFAGYRRLAPGAAVA